MAQGRGGISCLTEGGSGQCLLRDEPGRRRQEQQPGALTRTSALWPKGAAERRTGARSHPGSHSRSPGPHSHPRLPWPAPPATMNHSPLKTALAYECFQDQDNSTLALPSDQKMKTGTSGRQRVQEQVMMTVKRQKSKSSQSSTLSHSNRGKGARAARGALGTVRPSRCASVAPLGTECQPALTESVKSAHISAVRPLPQGGPGRPQLACCWGLMARCGSGWVAHWGTQLGLTPESRWLSFPSPASGAPASDYLQVSVLKFQTRVLSPTSPHILSFMFLRLCNRQNRLAPNRRETITLVKVVFEGGKGATQLL